MISNLRTDLKRMNLEDRAPEILEEAEQVRVDLGYPILVSPFAQYVIAQAMLNVLGSERYATIPDEVARYVRGHYGRLAGEVDPNVADRVFATGSSEPLEGRAGEAIPAALPKLRSERGPFDSDDDLLLAAFYSDQELTELKQARQRTTPTHTSAADPLTYLLDGLRSGPAGQTVRLERPGLRLSVVR